MHNTDVLIIGSGGAGLSAALQAHNHGSKVLVVSKTYPTHSQTCQAQGGINASLDYNKSSVQSHIDDTYKGGHKLSDINAVKFMCEEAGSTIEWLDKLGVPFSRNSNNAIAQRKFGAASKIRTCYSSDYTGLKILHTLYDNCIKEKIEFLNEYLLLNILVNNNQSYGASILDIKTSRIHTIHAKTIILATGGYCNLYNQFTTNSHSTTGDGIAAAFRAGCELSNMEMVQFHPTAMIENNILISESARGEGGYLVNEKGERFIDELQARDVIARAIFKKLKNNETVFLDLRHISKDRILKFMPQEYRLAKDFLNIEIDKELLPVNPAAHYSMGGIKTNVSCETNIKNLYACGECSQNGIHGANRLGGNSLLEIITFGKVAGKNASNQAEITKESDLNFSKEVEIENAFIDKLYNHDNPKSFYSTKKEIGNLFFNNVGLFRDERSLLLAKDKLTKIEETFYQYGITDKSKTYNKNLVEYLEFKNMLELAPLVLESAINRKESRGAHFRSDCPNELKEYQKNSISKKNSLSIDYYFEEIQ